MLLIVGAIGGLIVGVIAIVIGLIEIFESYNNKDKIKGGIIFLVGIISLMICLYCALNLYTESIETVTITNKFVDTHHSPSNGFLDTNNIEYHYDIKDDLYINSTYKMKVQHNQDTGFNKVLYVYD